MAKPRKAKAATTIRLDARIDDNDQLIVSYREPELERLVLRSESALADLAAAHPGKKTLTLEVRDFFQRGTVYEVYGAVLDDDGHHVAAHWEPTDSGQRHTFAIPSAAAASKIRIVIAALPRRPDAPIPAPLAPRAGSGSGGFPIAVEPPPKGS